MFDEEIMYGKSDEIFEPIRKKKGRVRNLREYEKELRRKSALARRKKRIEAVRKNVNDKKAKVYARYGTTCYLCGKKGSDTIDHVIPLSKGGSNGISNLRPAHEKCNKDKGKKIVILPEELEEIGW